MTELLSFEKSRRSAGGPRLPDAGVTAPAPVVEAVIVATA